MYLPKLEETTAPKIQKLLHNHNKQKTQERSSITSYIMAVG